MRIRGGCLLAAAAIFLLVLGIDGVRTSLLFRADVNLSFEEFVRRKPAEGWFTVSGCYLDLTDAVFEVSQWRRNSSLPDEADDSGKQATPGSGSNSPESKDSWISEAWVPVRSINARDATSTPLVLDTTDDRILSLLRDIRSLEIRKASDHDIRIWLTKNANRISSVTDLHGMVQAAYRANEKNRSEVSRISGIIEPEYIVIDDGAKPPTVGAAVAMIFFGLVCGLLAVLVLAGSVSNVLSLVGVHREPDPPPLAAYTRVAPPISVPFAQDWRPHSGLGKVPSSSVVHDLEAQPDESGDQSPG